MANIRWKLITIVLVLVVFAGVGVYPIVAARYGIHSPGWLMDKQLKLGLDLNGGVQLVLRVQTDDALKLETDSDMERLRQEMAKRNIPFTNLTSPDPTRFRVEGVPPAQDAAFRQASNGRRASSDRPGCSNSRSSSRGPRRRRNRFRSTARSRSGWKSCRARRAPAMPRPPRTILSAKSRRSRGATSARRARRSTKTT